MTTSELNYPVLMYGKYGLLKRHRRCDELICNTRNLRLFEQSTWWRIVDNDLNEYELQNYRAVRNVGGIAGFYFDGPFLIRRKVLFVADVKPLRRLASADVRAIYVEFVSKAQDGSETDRFRLQELASQNLGLLSIASIESVFTKFDWGRHPDYVAEA